MRSFIKRFVPFFLTFAFGLLVASFFVSVAAPSFQFKRDGKHGRYYRLKCENEKLRRENMRLERRLAERRAAETEYMGLDVPPPPMPPMPPPAPVAPRRIDR
jgi:hypothetical protein